MALTTLDRNSALLVVDLQNAIVALETAHPAQDVVQRAAELAKAFLGRAAGQPPGRTEQQLSSGGPMPERPMELADALDQQPGDHLVTKRARSAFTGTGLLDDLRQLGVTQVVLAGIATSVAVESSAR